MKSSYVNIAISKLTNNILRIKLYITYIIIVTCAPSWFGQSIPESNA